jgi:RHH-type rel operon transcriptional repressor/antitoxin RelB
MSILSIRLPDDLAHRLEGLSSSLDRPKSYLIRKAIETYLAEYADYQAALDRLHDKDDAVVSSAALRKKLGL